MSYELKNVFAVLPQMQRAAGKVIGGDPAGNTFLYTNKKSVIIRNIKNPSIADIYTEHVADVSVAKYSPSGYYIASGDCSGKIRIWDTTQSTHLLKYEYMPFAGKIKDLAWTEDSKRIAVVGEGQEKFGAVFLADTGSSVGEINGHSKIANTVDIKQTRPYRIASGSDDRTVCFYEGPPFKFKSTLSDHDAFVNSVRFSPNGSLFATGGSGGKIILYDGKTAENPLSLGSDKAHSGGVYAVSWSRDGSHLMSASGDKTVKLWDVEKNIAVTTFQMGNQTDDQQLGCLWQNDYLLSISLSGCINYLDKNNPDKPIRIIKGHSQSIQCLTVHTQEGRKYICTGSQEGLITYWDAETGDGNYFSGIGHTNQVRSMTIEDNELVTCSMDDTVRYTNMDKKEYSAADVVKMDFQPKKVSASSGRLSLAVCIGQIVLLKNKKKVFTLEKPGYEPEVCALHPGLATAAVGGADAKVHLYSIRGDTLVDNGQTLDVNGIVTDMAYSFDGAHLAVTDDKKAVTVFSVADNYSVKDEFYGHHAKITALAWSPDNNHLATGGMDSLMFVWSLDDSNRRIKITEPHRLYHISSMAWLDENTIVTTAYDGTVKQWTIKY
ncbi:WD repeat-containing protein 1 isoform X2 [Thalassophryne amazonica]|uniref:WD repeat-containing protein 1 isoform X2 n=1 Tax=Thalassophryne amazonica TaxID=390379 RepID=UPI00147243F8|nr:WD repeat-containing protein 1 isoform X2 [Thalassophryne amazonica]